MKSETQTLQQKLASRKIGRPPAGVYQILGYLWRLMYQRRLNIRFDYRIDLRDYRKGPYIVVSNHASRLDYIYTGVAFLPQRLNYVAGYNEFFRSHLAFIFRFLKVIPKRNFVPDIYTLRQFDRILKSGGKAIIFPEGMSSISGSNQPCALGGGALLKQHKVPVLMTKIKGGYLTTTKYCLDERPGRVDVTIDLLFTPADLERMSAEEIQKKLDEVLLHDDYAWNKIERVKFDGKGRMAHNLHHLLYRCPKCHGEFTMKGEGDTIRCLKCGNGARLNEYYDLVPLDGACVIPETPRTWFDQERQDVYHQVRDEKFELREKVSLGILPKDAYLKDQKTSEIAGEGEPILNRGGLTYTGTKGGVAFSFHLGTDHVPTYGICTDMSRFYTFFKGEFYEFYPEGETVAKWLFATEELHRLNGGQWKDFPDAATYAE